MTKQVLQSPNAVVVGACRNPEKATNLQALANSAPGRLHIVPIDIVDQESVRKCAEQVTSLLGGKGVDYLINNAGVVQGKRIIDLSPEDVHQYGPSAYIHHACTHYRFCLQDILSQHSSPFLDAEGIPAWHDQGEGWTYRECLENSCLLVSYRVGCQINVSSVAGMVGMARLSECMACSKYSSASYDGIHSGLQRIEGGTHLSALVASL